MNINETLTKITDTIFFIRIKKFPEEYIAGWYFLNIPINGYTLLMLMCIGNANSKIDNPYLFMNSYYVGDTVMLALISLIWFYCTCQFYWYVRARELVKSGKYKVPIRDENQPK